MCLFRPRILVVFCRPGVLRPLSSVADVSRSRFCPSLRLCLCLPRPCRIPRTLGPLSARVRWSLPHGQPISFSQDRGFVLRRTNPDRSSANPRVPDRARRGQRRTSPREGRRAQRGSMETGTVKARRGGLTGPPDADCSGRSDGRPATGGLDMGPVAGQQAGRARSARWGLGPPWCRPAGPRSVALPVAVRPAVTLSSLRMQTPRVWTIHTMRTWTSCAPCVGTRCPATTTGCSHARAAR